MAASETAVTVQPTTAAHKAATVQARLTVVEAQAIDTGKTKPTKIVRIHDDWGIQVKWALAEAQQLPQDMQWVVSVYLESIGKKAKEYDLPAATVPKDVTSVIVEPDPGEMIDPGVYRMGVAMTGRSSAGQPLPIAAYRDGGAIQFFDAG